jgi:hypothetical protein
MLAVLLASLIFVMPAMAQSARVNGLPGLKLPIPLSRPAPAVAPSEEGSGDTLANIMKQLEKVTKDNIAAIVTDIQAADADASIVVIPALPPVPPATVGTPAVVKDPISHACYPALVQFLQAIPQVATPTGTLVGFQLFQAKRDFIQQLKAGLPTYLKLGCAPLLGDEINITIQALALVGVKILPAGIAAICPPCAAAAAPLALPAMTLVP